MPDKINWHIVERKMLVAHQKNNITALAKLYQQAANGKKNMGDIEAEAFFLTHALVFALEGGLLLAHDIRQRLIKLGREN